MSTREMLLAYTRGELSRGAIMAELGLSWYGDLLRLMNEHQVPRPVVSEDDEARQMDKAIARVFGHPATRKT